jgi:prepilin-type N-terminal cleavage/methylation domain-containing protein
MRTHLRQSLHRLHDRGYTLVEIMMVVLLLGIVATLAAPHLSQSDASRLPAAMRLLEADLAYAQSCAIAQPDDPCVVVFDPHQPGYHLARASQPEVPIEHPIDKQPYRVVFGQDRASFLAGVTIKDLLVGDDLTLGFRGFGQLDQTTPAVVILTHDRGSMTLRLDPATGLPTITR